MAQDEADLMGIGQHCSVQHCRLRDFLPFRCQGCGRTFCSQHRTHAAHGCSAAQFDDVQVIVCPICLCGVQLGPLDDPNAAFDAHQRSGCDPANYERVNKRPRCPVKGCKEKLTTINTYTCKDCKARVCLRHRLAQDHACSGPAAPPVSVRLGGSRAAAAMAAAAAAGCSLGSRAAAAVGSAAAGAVTLGGARPPVRQPQQHPARAAAPRQQQQQQQPDPANTLLGSAARRRQQASGRREQCPHCSRGFDEVVDLIAHVERDHAQQRLQQSRAGAGDAAGGVQYACPRCRAAFADPVALVAHSERCGQASVSAPQQCVLS